MTSQLINKIECEKCEDAKWGAKHKGLYDDDHTFCFRCKTLEYNVGLHKGIQNDKSYSGSKEFIGKFTDIADRGISAKTCEKLGVLTGKVFNQDARCYMYDNGLKVRLLPKEFTWIEGKASDCSMLGLDQCKDYTAPVIVCEGEDDMLSCWEIDYQACSLHSGAGSVKVCLQHDMKELLKYSEIWLGFDNDEPGKEATKIALEMLPADKVKIIDWESVKDANEALLNNSLTTILTTNVTEWRPEGVIFGNELDWDKIWQTREQGIQLPWKGLQELIRGLHKGRLYLLGGGASIGKSSVLRELVYFLKTSYKHLKIAHLFLEEDQEAGPLTYMALHKNIPLGELLENKSLIPKAEREQLQKELLGNGNIMFTNEQYELGSEELLKQLEWLATVKKYDIIVLDHISMVAEASESKESERILINKLMLKLRSLVRRTGLIVIAACHLSNPDQGKDWEEGREVKQKDFHGSSALRKVPDVMIGVERNLRDKFNCDELTLRVIKNRWFGKVGECDRLIYFEKSGRLLRHD